MLIYVRNGQESAGQEHSRAIVTIVLGDEYERVWELVCRDSWERYGREFGYDVIAIKAALDQSPRASARSPAWQKLLILSQSWSSRYERIVWLDADIIISPSAYDISSFVPNREQVGIASNEQISAVESHVYREKIHNIRMHPDEFARQSATSFGLRTAFEAFGIITDDPVEYNTGVLVLAPDLHADLLLDVYQRYEQSGPRYEQMPLSHTLQRAGILQFISPRFNWNIHIAIILGYIDTVVPEEFIRFLRNELRKAYFLHFPGSMPVLRMLADWREQANFVI